VRRWRWRPNDLSLSCTARAHVPKPTRHGGCRGARAKTQPAICNRRDADHSSVLTSRLGRRASAGPCRLLARVGRRHYPYMEKVKVFDRTIEQVTLPPNEKDSSQTHNTINVNKLSPLRTR
jgi:hypothetical protein